MAHSFEILPRQHLVVVLYADQLARNEFDELWQELRNAPEFDWTQDELVLFGPDAELANLSFEKTGEVARQFTATHRPIEARRRFAIVVSNQMQVLAGRMFLAFIAANPPPNIEFKLFSKVSTALAWIEEGRPVDAAWHRIDKAEVERSLAALDHARRQTNGERHAEAG